jgi:XapX domain-containing protein
MKILVCSTILGYIFAKLNLAIPCPPNVLGILGIIGLFLGYKLKELL